MTGIEVLVRGGSLACSHQGSASLTTGSSRLTVLGAPVLTSGDEAGLGCLACGNVTTTSPSSPAPCVTDAASAGAATRITVAGTPVLLATAAGPTHPSLTPAAPGTWHVADAGQSKLRAV